MSRQIIFVPLHKPSMLEMLPTARLIDEDGQYQPCFFVYRDIPYESIEDIRREGFQVIGPNLIEKQNTGKDNDLASVEVDPETSSWRKQIKKVTRWVQSMTITSFILNLITYYVTLRKVRQLIDEQPIAAIITIGDRHVGWETALIKVAGQNKIPSVIVPYALSDPNGSATFRLRNTENDSQYYAESISGRWAEKKHPKWVYSYKGRRLLYLPIGAAQAARF